MRCLRHLPGCCRLFGGGLLALAALTLSGDPLRAQGTIRGQVVSGAPRTLLHGATVSVARGGPAATTDSLGQFVVAGVAMGERLLIAMAPGFRAETLVVDLDVDVLELSPITLQRVPQSLAGVTVTGEATTMASRISGFEERRRFGNGAFIDRAMLERFANRQTSDVLAALAPGVSIRRGRGMKAWASSGRTPSTSGGTFGLAGGFQLDKSDIAAGARPACYMDVYLNGALIYNSKGGGIPLHDVNSIPPEQVESIEAYAGASQVPAQFNRTSGGCGVLVIWTRS